MTRRTIQNLLSIAALASSLVILSGCESTQTGNPERMQKSLEQQRKGMGAPGGAPPKMPSGPGMPYPGTAGGQASTGASGGQ